MSAYISTHVASMSWYNRPSFKRGVYNTYPCFYETQNGKFRRVSEARGLELLRAGTLKIVGGIKTYFLNKGVTI